MSITDLAVIAAQCLWGLCEFVIYKRMKSNDENADQSSYKTLYNIAICSLAVGIFIGVFFKFDNFLGLYNSSLWFPVTGAGLIVLGLMLRLTAINQLKRYFTINVAIRDDHRLIRDGLYKYIRHPAYAGGIISFIGCGLCYGNILSFLIIAVPYILLILNRIKYEEIVLVRKFGNDYIEMQKKTKKLIPFIY
jgi:protein-S-isoprenylcysteine O-methyltransferase Ste14